MRVISGLMMAAVLVAGSVSQTMPLISAVPVRVQKKQKRRDGFWLSDRRVDLNRSQRWPSARSYVAARDKSPSSRPVC